MSVALAGNQEGAYNLWWELNLSTGKVGDNSGQAQAFWHKDRRARNLPSTHILEVSVQYCEMSKLLHEAKHFKFTANFTPRIVLIGTISASA